jgi:hypothetical protein
VARKRVHEIAKAQGLTSKEVLAALAAAGIEAKAAASSVEEADALKALKAANGGGTAAPAEKAEAPAPKQQAAPAPATTAEAWSSTHRRRDAIRCRTRPPAGLLAAAAVAAAGRCWRSRPSGRWSRRSARR